jgi:outer membrane receptor protein involved in Fe transport
MHSSSTRKHFFTLATLLTGLATSALSQNNPTDSTKTYDLREVVVTATRSAAEKSRVPQKIDVISSKDIALTSGQEFTDLLKKNASLDIIQYPSLLSGVGIRGFRPQTGSLNQRSLLLIDGRPAGTTNLATIDMSSIERVEVLKGSASALYGSQAVGGVINLITRKSEGEIRTALSAEYGTYQTFRQGVNVGGSLTKKLNFDASFLYFRRAGNYRTGSGNLFRNGMGNDKYVKFLPNGTSEEISDRRADGDLREYSKLGYVTGSLRLGYQLNEKWSVNVRGEGFQANDVQAPSDVAYGNSQPNTKDTDRLNGEVSVNGDLGNHQLLFKTYAAGETTGNYNINSGGVPIPPYLSFQSENQWYGFQIRDAIRLQQHGLTIGADYTHAATVSHSFRNDGTESSPFSPNYALASTAVYAQGQLNLLDNRLSVNPGLRYDLIQYIGRQTPLLDTYTADQKTNPFLSPSLGIKAMLIEGLSVYANAGRAFVTPDAFNVAGFSQNTTGDKQVALTRGNPNLKNENSISWDAGIRFDDRKSGLNAELTYFSTYVRDRITRQTTPITSLELTANGDTVKSRTTYINANKAEIRGLEAELAYDLGALNDYSYSLRLFANATSMIKSKEITVNAATGAETERDIFNVSKLNIGYGVEYDNLKALRIRLSGRYVGYRRDTDFTDAAFPEIRYPAFMVIDLVASYTLAQHHTLGLFVNNLTDENYYEKRGFNMPGRTVSFRYTVNF